MKYLSIKLCAVVTVAAFLSTAEVNDTLTNGTIISGYSSFEFGQFPKAEYMERPLNHWWIEDMRARLECTATLNDWTRIRVGIECEYSPTFRHSNVGSIASEFFIRYYPHQAEGILSFLRNDRARLELGIGYFPYKYNEDVRNLGEYFFRMRPYPGYIDTKFDFPLERLLGSRLHSDFSVGSGFIKLTNDLLLLSATQAPVYDLSIAYLGRVTFGNIGHIGFGLDLNRCLAANDSLTTPPDDIYVDSLNNTYHYSSKSTNVLCYASFDPKALLRSDLFGKEDLKIYGEAAIMGTKNYPYRFDSLWQRIPVMGGINIPTFKVLDVFACEVEWWGNPWPNSLYLMYFSNARPKPQGVDQRYDTLTRYKISDNWKWSVYAKRSFKNMEIIAQIARDHFHGFYVDLSEKDWYEVCARPNSWYYVLKFKYNF